MKTERIGFSRWNAADLDLATQLWGEEEVTRYICASGKFTTQDIIHRLETEIQNEEQFQVQYWPVFEMATGGLIGCCGLRPFPSETNSYEIGVHLRKKYWGAGFAAEAAGAVIHYSFATLKADKLYAGHHPKNKASGDLLEKLGFRYIGDHYYEPTGLYHPSYEFTNNNGDCREEKGYLGMKEEEKIFAGKMFDPRKKELRDIKHKAHAACQRFNTLDEYDPKRLPIIKEFIGGIGKTYYFQGPIQFNYGSHAFIGENFFANFNLVVMDDARIYIGNNVCFGPNVSLMATSHPLIAQERMGLDAEGHTTMAEYADEIHIGNNVWIACNAVVLGGVHIGDNAVIGAGSVVTKDIPDNYLAFGNPCRPVRLITEADSKKDLILEGDNRGSAPFLLKLPSFRAR